MENFITKDHRYRRYKAHVSSFGTSQVHLRNPYITAWWSAAFPGFGHLLLGKYMRGLVLFVWEVFVNYQAKINVAMVHSFCGEIDLAKQSLHPRWMLMYIPVYIFSIWDSYRSTVDMNKVYLLAEKENAPFNTFSLGTLEINYLDKRSPVMSIIWSIFMPGLGYLHISQIISAFFSLTWTIAFLYFSHLLEAVQFLFLGEIKLATKVLDMQWLMYMPSMWGFGIYHSYINTVENNKLYENEQQCFLRENYQNPAFRVIKGRVAD